MSTSMSPVWVGKNEAGKSALVQALYRLNPAHPARGGATVTFNASGEVPADVVLDPQHARALRLAREAQTRLAAGDIDVPAANLGAYDALLAEVGA
jgi:hypothetical protein